MSCAHIPPNTSYLMLIFTVNEAKDEADAKSEEISELQSQIRKAAIEKRRADDKIELLEGDKEALESKVAKFQDEMDKTIGDYETRIDSKFLSVALSFLPSLSDVRIDQYLPPHSLLSLYLDITMKYLDKIDNLTNEKNDVEDQLSSLREEHDKTTSDLKAAETELSANKFAYERRIENLEKELDGIHEEME